MTNEPERWGQLLIVHKDLVADGTKVVEDISDHNIPEEYERVGAWDVVTWTAEEYNRWQPEEYHIATDAVMVRAACEVIRT